MSKLCVELNLINSDFVTLVPHQSFDIDENVQRVE